MSVFVFFGHHRCASVYFRFEIMTPLLEFYNIPYIRVTSGDYYNFDVLIEGSGSNIEYGLSKRENNFCYLVSNSTKKGMFEFNSKIKEYKGLHVIRDPRNLLVSSYA